MNKKVNEMLLDVIEKLTYFTRKPEDDLNERSKKRKEWWQNYLMCAIFCLFIGVFVIALSSGLFETDGKTNEGFFNEDFVKDGPPDLYKNAENLLVMKGEPSAIKSVVAVKSPKIKE